MRATVRLSGWMWERVREGERERAGEAVTGNVVPFAGLAVACPTTLAGVGDADRPQAASIPSRMAIINKVKGRLGFMVQFPPAQRWRRGLAARILPAKLPIRGNEIPSFEQAGHSTPTGGALSEPGSRGVRAQEDISTSIAPNRSRRSGTISMPTALSSPFGSSSWTPAWRSNGSCLRFMQAPLPSAA